MMEIGVDYTGVRIGTLITNESGQILLVKDKMGYDPEKWTVPTAMLKRFEKIKYAVDREIYEEFNIDVQTNRVLDVLDLFAEDKNLHMIVPVYHCDLLKGQPKKMNPFKYTEMEWYNINELPDGILEGVESCITIYKNRLAHG